MKLLNKYEIPLSIMIQAQSYSTDNLEILWQKDSLDKPSMKLLSIFEVSKTGRKDLPLVQEPAETVDSW
jgi:hypothetical protein